MTALSGLPASAATAAKSASTAARAKRRAAATSRSSSSRPSLIADFSTIVKTRCVEAISSVRSGVTKPAWTERAASNSSVASTTSTRPGAGLSARIGAEPAAPGMSSR